MSTPKTLVVSLVAAALVAAAPADAVRLSDNGNGDLLIFPVLDLGSGFGVALSLYPEHDDVASLLRLNLRDGSDGSLRGALNIAVPVNATATLSMSGSSARVTGGLCATSSTSPESWTLDTAIELGDDFGGFLEVIEMARVARSNEAWDAFAILGPGGEATAMDCDAVGSYLASPDNLATLLPASTDVVNPGGDGVSGNLHLVDVENGLSFSIAPTVMREFRDAPLYAPADSEQPSLADASPATSTVEVVDADDGSVQQLVSTWEHPEDAVSALLMTSVVETEFSTEAALGAATDLVLTFPTRHHYVQSAGADDASSGGRQPFGDLGEEPGQYLWINATDRIGNSLFLLPDDAAAKNFNCTSLSARQYLEVPNVIQSQFTLHMAEAPIIRNGQLVEAVQGPYLFDDCSTSAATPVHNLIDSGQLRVHPASSMFSLEGHELRGLPLVATSLTRVINSQLQGDVRANYGLVNEVVTRRYATVGVAK